MHNINTDIDPLELLLSGGFTADDVDPVDALRFEFESEGLLISRRPEAALYGPFLDGETVAPYVKISKIKGAADPYKAFEVFAGVKVERTVAFLNGNTAKRTGLLGRIVGHGVSRKALRDALTAAGFENVPKR